MFRRPASRWADSAAGPGGAHAPALGPFSRARRARNARRAARSFFRRSQRASSSCPVPVSLMISEKSTGSVLGVSGGHIRHVSADPGLIGGEVLGVLGGRFVSLGE